jgi:hypothetical protein
LLIEQGKVKSPVQLASEEMAAAFKQSYMAQVLQVTSQLSTTSHYHHHCYYYYPLLPTTHDNRMEIVTSSSFSSIV